MTNVLLHVLHVSFTTDSSSVLTTEPSAQPMNVDAEISLDQSHMFNISLPVLDLSDPASLLELISSGYPLMENEDDNSFPDIEIDNSPDIDGSISELFMPKKLESRNETKSNVEKKTSHTILTSNEIAEHKREVELRKNEKETKQIAKRSNSKEEKLSVKKVKK